MNKFFDLMNVRSTKEGQIKRNSNLRPYETTDDERFDWLKNVFLKYFDDWESNIAQRQGFTKTEKEKMFISKQTKIGLKITVLSMVECTRFLLNSGMKYVLTEKFSQDSLELYFGLQRACGHRSDNPTLTQFGYNDNAIRIKGTLSTPNIQGNTKGGQKNRKYAWYNVDDDIYLISVFS